MTPTASAACAAATASSPASADTSANGIGSATARYSSTTRASAGSDETNCPTEASSPLRSISGGPSSIRGSTLSSWIALIASGAGSSGSTVTMSRAASLTAS